MPLKKSCLSCKYNHDLALKSAPFSWCLLRKIKLPTDFSGYAFCHHWTQQDQSLQSIADKNNTIEQQLDFGRELVTTNN